MTAPDQTDLFGSEEPPPTPVSDGGRQTLFYAQIPPPSACELISSRGESLRSCHGLGGKLLAADRMHITLVFLAESIGPMPVATIEAARAAAASVRHRPLDIVLDQALSFPTSHAFVLSGSESAAVADFCKVLASPLKRYGLKPRPAGTPHLTLLYDRQHQVEAHPIDPIRWTAASFSLVLSHVGKTLHDHLGAWPLRA